MSFVVPAAAPEPALESPRRATNAELTALALTLKSLGPLLQDSKITELCINRPGAVFIETASGWQQVSTPQIDFDWCLRFAKLVANYSHQRVDATSPLLSASLPDGERVQLVLPPATSTSCMAISIRRPAPQLWSIEELAQRGIFRSTRRADTSCDQLETQLLAEQRQGAGTGTIILANAAFAHRAHQLQIGFHCTATKFPEGIRWR